MTWLTTPGGPWQITVTLNAHEGGSSDAQLEGTTVVNVVDGFANFTDLRISHDGSYSLTYQVTRPTTAGLGTLTTSVFSLPARYTVVILN
jgi:hypothetical protein